MGLRRELQYEIKRQLLDLEGEGVPSERTVQLIVACRTVAGCCYGAANILGYVIAAEFSPGYLVICNPREPKADRAIRIRRNGFDCHDVASQEHEAHSPSLQSATPEATAEVVT